MLISNAHAVAPQSIGVLGEAGEGFVLSTCPCDGCAASTTLTAYVRACDVAVWRPDAGWRRRGAALLSVGPDPARARRCAPLAVSVPGWEESTLSGANLRYEARNRGLDSVNYAASPRVKKIFLGGRSPPRPSRARAIVMLEGLRPYCAALARASRCRSWMRSRAIWATRRSNWKPKAGSLSKR